MDQDHNALLLLHGTEGEIGKDDRLPASRGERVENPSIRCKSIADLLDRIALVVSQR